MHAVNIRLTVGRRANGELLSLYVGPSGDAAEKALLNPPEGVIETGMILHPIFERVRSFEVKAQAAVKPKTEAKK